MRRIPTNLEWNFLPGRNCELGGGTKVFAAKFDRCTQAESVRPSDGDDTKASLAHAHEMRFLLDRADYDRISPLLTNALWPYSAPRPDKADDEYIGALKALVVGQLKFTVRTYDADPVNGSIRRIKFQAEFRTPGNFEFDPALKPKPAAFPSFSD